MSSLQKVTLRTVPDIVSRLRWEKQFEDCIIGYEDRIHGPLERALEDYTPIAQGGDLPEHRIWYVRSGSTVLWDKHGRLDRLFESGNGGIGPASAECQLRIQEARVNMKRLEEEKEQRKSLKEKERARKARRRRLQATSTHASPIISGNSNASRIERFQWISTPFFSWSGNKWCQRETEGKTQKMDQLTIISWNILFDIFDPQEKETEERWTQLVDHLAACNADVVALQEVTPTFIKILFSADWTHEYVTTCGPDDTSSVSPSGNLLLWKRAVFSAVQAKLCIDGDRRRAALVVLQHGSILFSVANVHLPANRGPDSRHIARQRELSAVLAEMLDLRGNSP
jgi:poly(A) polymerase